MCVVTASCWVNSYSVPLSVTWRVPQTGEEGSATVAAADTTRHPSASEQLVETRSKGTLELYLGERKVKSRANGAIPCATGAAVPSFTNATAAETGSWSEVLSWPMVAVHMNLMPNGKVLAWGSAESGVPRVWDPSTNTFITYLVQHCSSAPGTRSLPTADSW